MMKDGYYWIEALDHTQFVALLAKGSWWVPGVENPVFLHPGHVLWPVIPLGATGSTPLEVGQPIH
jgi:hypothetical protein